MHLTSKNASRPTDVVVYGIANCDTVRRARAWLADHGIDAAFHDFRKDGVPTDALAAWADTLGWERLLNRKGTTWRKLDKPIRAAVIDTASAKAVMQAQPSVIKRPVVDWGAGRISVGFDAPAWRGICGVEPP